jgi:hypothetical protein
MLVASAGLLHRDADIGSWEAVVRSGGSVWALVVLSTSKRLAFRGGSAPEPPVGRPERVAQGETLYDMEAMQVWQRENHAGHVAVLFEIIMIGECSMGMRHIGC